MKILITLLLIMTGLINVNAQNLEFELGSKPEIELDSIDYEKDIIINDTIYLDNSDFYSVSLKTELELKYYSWLRKRVRDVWPYVRTAVREYNAVNDTIASLKKKKDQKNFIKERQKLLADKFENDLKQMTVSRGQIITKLIYKETNKTVYDIIKQLKGRLNAFLYNTAGGAYDINLKETFNPKKSREDLYIYIILKRDLNSGLLQQIYDETE